MVVCREESVKDGREKREEKKDKETERQRDKGKMTCKIQLGNIHASKGSSPNSYTALR